MTLRARQIVALSLLSLCIVALSTAVHLYQVRQIASSPGTTEVDLVAREVRYGLAVGAIALGAALAVALSLSNATLRPIRRLAEDLERLRRGEFDLAASGGSAGRTRTLALGEIGRLASELQQLGKQMESTSAQFLSERTEFSSVHAAVDHLDDGILFATVDGRIVFANRSAEAVLGRPARDAIGKHLADVFAADHPVRLMMQKAMEDGAPARNAKIEVPAEGDPLELLTSVFPVSGSGTGCAGAILIMRDLMSVAVPTSTFESLLQYSAQLAALGEVTAKIAHDVKNPLQAMVVRIAYLRERLASPAPDVTRSLEVLEAEINRASAVVDRFMEVVYPADAARLPVDVNALLREVTTLVQADWQSKGVTLTLREAPDLPEIRGDEDLLRRAFMNLIVNACEAMPRGGTVTITSEVEIGSYLKVTISDPGVGIARENVERVFRMYYSTKPDGTGIGLPLVRRVVDLHHGSIEILSTVGRGTTVSVRLPVHSTERP